MNAPITEAHRKLACDVLMEHSVSGAATKNGVIAAAQLIADSEAKAVAEWQNSAHIKGEAIDSLLAECDRLRAEVEALKQSVESGQRVLREDAERNAARAERAEASLHALRLVCGTTDADKFTTWVDRANARAEKAEAELHGVACARTDGILRESDLEFRLRIERARLDWLGQLDGFSRKWYLIMDAVNIRAAIDAAMKGDA